MKQEGPTERGSPLALFSYLVIASIQPLKSDAYGLGIANHLIGELGTLIDPGQIYTTLKRLRKRGLIKLDPKSNIEDEGKKVYIITKLGIKAMDGTEKYVELAAHKMATRRGS